MANQLEQTTDTSGLASIFCVLTGLTSNVVNTIYKDKNGELWFGADGDGICKFNGTTFSEFIIK